MILMTLAVYLQLFVYQGTWREPVKLVFYTVKPLSNAVNYI